MRFLILLLSLPTLILADSTPVPSTPTPEPDLVEQIPGIIFNANFKTYSGYLYGNSQKTWKMHYMLTEARVDPDNAPLLFWFNGGPGCSSFSGSFEELGPFYIDKDGKSIYENVYSWNFRANVLYLESPVGTGFSYDSDNPKYDEANDNQTLDQNYNAVVDFFTRAYPKYQNRPFFLSGESYAGIYIPMLASRIVENIFSESGFPNPNFQGFAIGNGFMDTYVLANSLVLWSSYHGRIELEKWDFLKHQCCNSTNTTGSVDADSCDWTKYLKTTNNMDFIGDSTPCGVILNDIFNATGLYNIDPYNYYQDCYAGSLITYRYGKPRRHYRDAKISVVDYNNPADLINRNSSDNMWGYPCYQEDYVAAYFSDPKVQEGFHIDKNWTETVANFSDCNNDLYNKYVNQYRDMSSYFNNILFTVKKSNFQVKNFRILIYNGDVDTVCNYLGDAKFIDKVATANNFTIRTDRVRWWFRDNIAGFVQSYGSDISNVTIDVLTVKGSGHMVPLDRPGPSQQMITNFVLFNQANSKETFVNYSVSANVNSAPTPLPLLEFTAHPPSPTTTPKFFEGEQDLVKSIPGLLYEPDFKTYSGYLYGNDDKTWKMHYMLTGARTNPDSAPVVFWFSGGPGCSSFGGAFEELGPFYVNKDGKTLYENVYSWNHAAHVVYIESPVGTGFSYDTNNPFNYNATDDRTAEQNVHAINDFFSRLFPQYAGRKFYITGESYAGVYLPMLAYRILSFGPGFANPNFAGIAVGNGFMDVPGLTNSLVLWSNYHGRISLDNWEVLKQKCCNGTQNFTTSVDPDSCDWTSHLTSQNGIDWSGSESTTCGRLLNDIINATGIYPQLDQYNYYESCYASGSGTGSKFFARPRKHKKSLLASQNGPNFYSNPANLINRDSTDIYWGYPCNQDDYLDKYLNDPAVQAAFNIDPEWTQKVRNFSDCNAAIYNQWQAKYTNMSYFLKQVISIVTSAIVPYSLKNFHILVYNGDVDTVCNYLGDAKFIDNLSQDKALTLSKANSRTRWWYRTQVAGFVQSYKTNSAASNVVIDVLTVKGAGHFVPLDRAGPSQQMITNLILHNDSITQFVNYSSNANIVEYPVPLPVVQPTARPTQASTKKPSTERESSSSHSGDSSHSTPKFEATSKEDQTTHTPKGSISSQSVTEHSTVPEPTKQSNAYRPSVFFTLSLILLLSRLTAL